MVPTDRASEPRPAATAVLLRESGAGLEVLLTVRPKHLRFMGGASVFPGGAVAPEDLDPRWSEASVLSPSAAAALLHEEPPRALGWFVAALRESFEEVGFLAGSGDLSAIARADADRPGRFLEVCLGAGVKLATDRLVPAGRWITPLGASARFDARFFAVAVTGSWEPEPDPEEVAEAVWVTPARALEELGSGARVMAPPTIEMLQRLETHRSADAALQALRERGVGGRDSILSVRLAPSVHVVLAPNPGVMTGPGTNTYVVGRDPAVVIDPAVDDERYLDEVLSVAGRVRSAVVTHRHPDHVAGVAALVRRTGATVRAWGSATAGGVPVVPLAEGDRVAAGDAELVVLHTPGHASDHVCLLLSDRSGLFAGDNILGEGTAVIAPPDGDMRAYLGSLRRILDLGVERIFPGHFRPVENPDEVIRGYIEHREQRERAILEALAVGPLTVEEIVERVYLDVAPDLHPIARFSVLAHLQMCEEDGRVRRVGHRWIEDEGD